MFIENSISNNRAIKGFGLYGRKRSAIPINSIIAGAL